MLSFAQTNSKVQTGATMANQVEGNETGNFRNVIRIEEDEIRNHIDGMVKTPVEEDLNQYLDQRVDQICEVKR